MANTITYTRGTSYGLTHTYTAPQYLGEYLIFTVKTVQNDTDNTDLTNAVMPPKVIDMTGDAFPQSTGIVIMPTDVPVTTPPNNRYYWSIKVIDTSGAEYIVAQGTFALVAYTTNETSG
jgi:hypothetical protein